MPVVAQDRVGAQHPPGHGGPVVLLVHVLRQHGDHVVLSGDGEGPLEDELGLHGHVEGGRLARLRVRRRLRPGRPARARLLHVAVVAAPGDAVGVEVVVHARGAELGREVFSANSI